MKFYLIFPLITTKTENSLYKRKKLDNIIIHYGFTWKKAEVKATESKKQTKHKVKSKAESHRKKEF